METLAGWAVAPCVRPSSPGRSAKRPLGLRLLAAAVCGPHGLRGSHSTSCRRWGTFPVGICRRLQGGSQRVEALDVALGASLPCQEREYRLAVLLQRSGESYPGEEPSWVVELKPLNVVVPAPALFQDGDQSAVEVERRHFELFYGSLLSGQYRLLMGQKLALADAGRLPGRGLRCNPANQPYGDFLEPVVNRRGPEC